MRNVWVGLYVGDQQNVVNTRNLSQKKPGVLTGKFHIKINL